MSLITKNISEQKDNSKQQIAYDKIKSAIIKNELLPDTLLVERQLSATLGISRTPIREALRRLSGEGLIESIPDKGMFVSKIRFEDIIEIFELREALEGMAIRLFVLRKNSDIVLEMEECLAIQEKAFKEENYGLNVEMDLQFHHLYIKGAKNSRLESFINTVLDQNSRMAFNTLRDKERIESSLVQHKKVLESIKKGDASEAERLIQEHIINVKEYHISKYYGIK